MHTTLTNPFYAGNFVWAGKMYRGTHPTFIGPDLYERVQTVLRSHIKPKYGKQEIAFRGLLTCARDNCRITAERKRGNTFITAAPGIVGNATPHVFENRKSPTN